MSEETQPEGIVEEVEATTTVIKSLLIVIAVLAAASFFYKAHNYLHGDDAPKIKNQIYQIVTVEDSKLMLYYIETNKFPTISMVSNLFKTNAIIVSITQK